MKILYKTPVSILPSKCILSFVFVLLLSAANQLAARNYYFSSSSGSDSRSAAEASNPATPWKSITKLNAIFSMLQPGDAVLFKRGDVFVGTIKVAKSGTSSAPITFGAYGSGNKPVLTGFVELNNWKSLGNGLYESYHTSLGNATNMVVMNGQQMEMGRYPNSNATNEGYLNFESFGSNYLVDQQMTASPSWTGAEIVVRTSRFVIDRRKISSHSGTKLYLNSSLTYKAINGFGYFIQNHIRTLDRLGEWHQNTGTKKLTVFFGSSSPSGYKVKVAVHDDVIDVFNQDNIVIENLEISGANSRNIDLYSTDNIKIRNCDIYYAGTNGFTAAQTNGIVLENNHFNHTNNVAVWLRLNCNKSVVRNNKIENTAILKGMGQSGANRSIAIREVGTNNLLEGNTIYNTGYIPIFFSGNYTTIRNNVIDRYNSTKDDGGAIYTVGASHQPGVGQKVIGNIITGAVGASAGTNYKAALSSSGIYIDDYAGNIDILDNTISGCTKAGIFIHNAANIKLIGNTVYDNRLGLSLQHDVIALDRPIRGMTIKRNIFFSKLASQISMIVTTMQNDITSMGSMDSNYYCRPLDDRYVIQTSFLNSSGKRIEQMLDLESWKAIYKRDLASKRTAAQILTHKTKALIGNNRFSNGDFHSSISGANAYSTSSYTKSWVSNKIEAGTFYGTISSSTPGVYAMSVAVGAVSSKKNYIVRFSSLSAKDTIMNVFLRKSGSPYTVLSNNGAKTVTKITRTANHGEFLIQPRQDEANSVLFFEILSSKNSFWLDKVKFYEADVAVTNPDDSIRLVYNPSASSRTISLPGNFIDAANRLFSSSITLKPYGSAILIQKSGSVTTDPAANTQPVVNLTSPTVNSTYDELNSVQVSATAADKDGSIERVEFYKGDELIGKVTQAPYVITLKKIKAGKHKIKAKAFDNKGAIGESKEIEFNVKTAADQTVGSFVKITKPVVNQQFNGPADVDIAADAKLSEGSIARVQFYHGTRLIKTEYNAPYQWQWQNLAAGTYNITAKAVSASGKVISSKPVSFKVQAAASYTVKITKPVVNQRYEGPADVDVQAIVKAGDAPIHRVEFYHGSRHIKSEFNAPYEWQWQDLAPGTYQITAKVIDTKGREAQSQVVSFTVAPSNAAPAVAITSPVVNASFNGPASVKLAANASDRDGSITNVQFFVNDKLICTERNAPYAYTMNSVAAGTYRFVAKATDNNGKVQQSSVVTFTVKASGTSTMSSIASAEGALAMLPEAQEVYRGEEASLYPNPAVSQLFVRLGKNQSVNGPATLTISNFAGATLQTKQVALSGNSVEVNVADLAPGMYVLSIRGEGVRIDKKFVKQAK